MYHQYYLYYLYELQGCVLDLLVRVSQVKV